MSGQEDAQVHVATLKALMVIVPTGAPLPRRELQLQQAIMRPRDFVVRVYVLAGQKLVTRDVGSASDPYLRLSLGATTLDNRANFLSDETDPHFHAFFEFRTALPGDSLLKVHSPSSLPPISMHSPLLLPRLSLILARPATPSGRLT